MNEKTNELPLVTDADDITHEKHPEMYAELCGGCEDCDVADGDDEKGDCKDE